MSCKKFDINTEIFHYKKCYFVRSEYRLGGTYLTLYGEGSDGDMDQICDVSEYIMPTAGKEYIYLNSDLFGIENVLESLGFLEKTGAPVPYNYGTYQLAKLNMEKIREYTRKVDCRKFRIGNEPNEYYFIRTRYMDGTTRLNVAESFDGGYDVCSAVISYYLPELKDDLQDESLICLNPDSMDFARSLEELGFIAFREGMIETTEGKHKLAKLNLDKMADYIMSENDG